MAASLRRSIQIMSSMGLRERPVDGFRAGRCSAHQQERHEERGGDRLEGGGGDGDADHGDYRRARLPPVGGSFGGGPGTR